MLSITIGGTPRPGDVLTITGLNGLFSGGQHSASYTVLATDTLATIAAGIASAFNADTSFQSVGLNIDNNATLNWAQNFVDDESVPTGVSQIAVSSIDGSSNTKTSGYALSVNGGSTTNLTFDLNGNMTSDGTNAFAWDAADRMTKITYPGTNNFSTFIYDGLSRNVSIVETTAGSVTSTKQFVWNGVNRKEERDASGVLTKKFFGRGQMNSATKYFYDADHLGSIREMIDNSGVVQARYTFDPFGRVTKLSETVPADFGYARYYLHVRSGLNLTRTLSERAYKQSAVI